MSETTARTTARETDRWQILERIAYTLDGEPQNSKRIREALGAALIAFPRPLDPKTDFEGWAVRRFLEEVASYQDALVAGCEVLAKRREEESRARARLLEAAATRPVIEVVEFEGSVENGIEGHDTYAGEPFVCRGRIPVLLRTAYPVLVQVKPSTSKEAALAVLRKIEASIEREWPIPEPSNDFPF